jgi:uncharacterized protein (TIRG00374 family)
MGAVNRAGTHPASKAGKYRWTQSPRIARMPRCLGALRSRVTLLNRQENGVKKQIIEIALKYGLGLGLLGYVIWDNRAGLAEAFSRPLHFGPFLIALLMLLAAMPVTFFRWYILVRAQDLPFTFPNSVRLGLIGFYLSTFLPTSIGGDVIKAAFIAREQRRRTVAVATVLIDRAVGLCALVWLVAIVGGGFWLTGSLHELVGGESKASALAALETILLIAVAITAGSLLFWLLLGVLPDRIADSFAGRLRRIPKLGWSLSEFWAAVRMYRTRGRSIAIALGLSLIGHVGFVLTFYFAARTLADANDIPTMGAHFLLVPVGNAIQAGIPTPGGVGGAEWGFGTLYALVATRFKVNGVLGSLMQRVIFWILGLVGYLVYLRMKPALRPIREEPEAGAASPAVVASNDLESCERQSANDGSRVHSA